jgi:hypothetical protein
MGEDQEQTQQFTSAASAVEPKSDAPAPTGSDAVAADPFASTLTVAAGPAPSAPRLEPGRELGPVRLVREIGRGATGAVFHGLHTVLGRDVAVKFLINVTAGPGDAEGVRRFVDEARAAAAVRHPNLTQIFHADLDGSTPYLVLEYVQGPTLRQLLDHAGALTVPLTVAVTGDVAGAVAELHARGIIHRDIKPSNVLVDGEGGVFVTDFGLALRRAHGGGHGAAAETEFAGTPAYMAGEMFEGRVSPRSDVYAMGIMAFQLLTGATPFSGAFHELRDKHLREPLPSGELRARGVRAEVVEVLERATNKQAMFRYKAAPDFARALREAAGCGMPELARARKHLCDLVAARAAGMPACGAGGGTSSGEVRGPAAAGDDDPGSSLYTETISRIATLKRERRLHPALDPDASGTGSSTRLAREPEGSSVTPGAAPTASPAATSQPEAGDWAPGAAAKPLPAFPDPAPRAIPGPVLTVSVSAVVYGVLAAVWQVGVLCGARHISAELAPPSNATAALYLSLVPAALAHCVVAALFVPAAVGCLRLRRWGRRMFVALAATDLAFQLAVLLVALAWAAPVTASHLASRALASPDARTSIEASVTMEWLVQWLVLSLFPGIALAVMARPKVREAFDRAAQNPEPEDDASEPLF